MRKKHSSKNITFRFVKIWHLEVADQAVVAGQVEVADQAEVAYQAEAV